MLRGKLKNFNLYVLLVVFMAGMTFAGKPAKWETKKSRDGQITAEYKISKWFDKKGDDYALIEYKAKTVASVSVEKCVDIMKEVSNHAKIQGDKESKKIKEISENEWITYNYSKLPWPMKDVDCVTKMTFSENKEDKSASFAFMAAPDMYEKKEVRRMVIYDVKYSFKEMGDGKVEILTTAKMCPMIKAPMWMIKGSFPGTTFKLIEKLVELAENI